MGDSTSNTLLGIEIPRRIPIGQLFAAFLILIAAYGVIRDMQEHGRKNTELINQSIKHQELINNHNSELHRDLKVSISELVRAQ